MDTQPYRRTQGPQRPGVSQMADAKSRYSAATFNIGSEYREAAQLPSSSLIIFPILFSILFIPSGAALGWLVDNQLRSTRAHSTLLLCRSPFAQR